MSWSGSSPLARGGPHRHRRSRLGVGLIPARAGRTSMRSSSVHSSGAHPRSRGADLVRRDVETQRQGSSPLARGGPPPGSCGSSGRGLIPARAGQTSSAWAYPGRRRAHPRSRGADAGIRFTYRLPRGSSPLARGGRHQRCHARRKQGLIPARAGRTLEVPRGTIRASGSSPLARGGLRGRPRRRGRDGLIPARAGRTRSSGRPRSRTRAHPRSRGADRLRVAADPADEGSSPLARGRHHRHGPTPADVGLIPARAGRTPGSDSRIACRGAHPRSRGADDTNGVTLDGSKGSSPLARGGPSKSHAARSAPVAHPRSRGADSAGVHADAAVMGSSPLARGGRARAGGRGREPGLIPARAGRTPSAPPKSQI